MRNTVYLTGASDDMVVISGDVEDEAYAYDDDGEQGVIEFDCGVTFRVFLDGEIWRIEGRPEPGNQASWSIEHAPVEGLDRDYTDRATITGPFRTITIRNDGGRGRRTIQMPDKNGGVR